MWDIGVDMIAGLYTAVARLYTLLLDIINGSIFDNQQLNDAGAILYYLMGIFMLFRLAISLISYLVNPDAISDKQQGAGKIIVRILVSLILFLALPVIFEFFHEIEKVVVNPETENQEGIIFNLFGNYTTAPPAVNPFEEDADNSYNPWPEYDTVAKKREKVDHYPKDETSWNSPTEMTCYYTTSKHLWNIGKKDTRTYDLTKNYIIHFYYGHDNNGNAKQVGTFDNDPFTLVEGQVGVYYQYEVTSLTTPDGQIFNFSSGPDLSVQIQNSEGCYDNYCSHSEDLWATNIKDNNCPDAFKESNGKEHFNMNAGWFEPSVLMMNAGNSLDTFIGQIVNWYDTYQVQKNKDIVSFITLELGDYIIAKSAFTFTGSWQALDFSRNILNTFIECRGKPGDKGKVDECLNKRGKLLTNPGENKNFAEELKKEGEDRVASIDFIMALLVGVAVCAYLIVLCVEVVIRHIKLMFLEFISPIPVMANIDPNTKILGSWFKQYAATFCDLFIKILAISIAVIFIRGLNMQDINLWERIFWVFGLFTFAKTLPNFISDVFGIKFSMGTMGDTFKLLGKGAKMAAGAAVGSAAAGIWGLATGMMGRGGRFATGVGSLFSGMARGLASGAQGKVFKGAKDIGAANRRYRQLTREGGSPGGRMLARLSGGADKYHKAEIQKGKLKNYIEASEKLEKHGASELAKNQYEKFFGLQAAKTAVGDAQAARGAVQQGDKKYWKKGFDADGYNAASNAWTNAKIKHDNMVKEGIASGKYKNIAEAPKFGMKKPNAKDYDGKDIFDKATYDRDVESAVLKQKVAQMRYDEKMKTARDMYTIALQAVRDGKESFEYAYTEVLDDGTLLQHNGKDAPLGKVDGDFMKEIIDGSVGKLEDLAEADRTAKILGYTNNRRTKSGGEYYSHKNLDIARGDYSEQEGLTKKHKEDHEVAPKNKG